MPSKPTCPCEGQTLDRLLAPNILAFLADGPAHGYALVERLATSPLMNGTKPDRAGVYRALAAMEAQGTVTHSLRDSKIGPSKRLYQLTRDGRDCLKKWVVTLERYSSDVGALAKTMREVAFRD